MFNDMGRVERDLEWKNGHLVRHGYDINVKVKRLHPDAVIPEYATHGAAGFDLVAVEDVIIEPGETALIPIGIAFEIPRGFEMQIRMRSGIAKKTPLRLPNGVGTIDADYRGEVFMMFENNARIEYCSQIGSGITLAVRTRSAKYLDGTEVSTKKEYYDGAYIIRKGDRIAQGVIAPALRADFKVVDELSETKRGGGAFGSTGVR